VRRPPAATCGSSKLFLINLLGNLHSVLVAVQSIMNEATMTLKDESNEAGRVRQIALFIYIKSR
jgi:hypothetical protein